MTKCMHTYMHCAPVPGQGPWTWGKTRRKEILPPACVCMDNTHARMFVGNVTQYVYIYIYIECAIEGVLISHILQAGKASYLSSVGNLCSRPLLSL